MMPIRFAIAAPKPAPVQQVTWSGWHLSGPLEEWRPDQPDLWPHCVICEGDIKAGDHYALRGRFEVGCVSCSGVAVPKKAQAARPAGLIDRGYARSS